MSLSIDGLSLNHNQGGQQSVVQSYRNLLRFFRPDHFDPIARLSGQTSQRQWKMTPDRPTDCALSDYR